MSGAQRRHGAIVHTTGSHGCWYACLCGDVGRNMTTAGGASISWAQHVATATQSTTPASSHHNDTREATVRE